MRNILVECQPFDPATNQNVTIRLCSAWTVAPDTLCDGKLWNPAITTGPVFALSTWQNGQPTPLDITYGNISIKISEAFGNLNYQGLNFSGAATSVWFGQAGDPFSNYRRIFSGSMGPLVPATNNTDATIPLLGPETDLTANLLSQTYAGTGGAEGPSTSLGNLKPLAFGFCTNVSPVIIDSANQVYQYHAYGSCAISQVYEGALSLGAPKANVADYATLYSMALDSTEGEWATCTALGLFRLAAQPTNKITADVGAVATVGGIVTSLLELAGVPASLVDASVATASRGYSLYVTDQGTILDAIRAAALANERYLIADSVEKWHLASAVSNAAPGKLLGDRSAYPLVLTDQVKKETASDPVWRLRMGHTRVWSVNSLSEIAGGVAELGQDITAAKTAAEAAQTTAETAQADADFARARVENQASDGILDRTEKLSLIHDVQTYTAERLGLLSTASGLGVTTEATAYSTAYANLIYYLDQLTPAYTDLTADTPITPAYITYRLAYLTARTALTNANLASASVRANWLNVTGSGRPQDYATVGAQTGVNLSDGNGNTLTDYDIKTSLGTSENTNAVAGIPASTVIATINANRTQATSDLNNATSTLNTAVALAQAQANSAKSDTLSLYSITTSQQTSINNNYTAITNETVQRANVDYSLGQQIDTLTGTVGQNSATISNESIFRVNGDNALSSQISQTNSNFNSFSSSVNGQVSALTNLNGALSSKVDIVSASLKALNSPNLIANGSFQNGFSGWNAFGGANWEIVTGYTPVFAQTSNGGYSGIYTDVNNIQQGSNYCWGFECSNDSGDNHEYMSVQWLNSSGSIIYINDGHGDVGYTTGWNNRVASGPYAAPSGAYTARVVIYLFGNDSGKRRISRLQLQQSDSPSAYSDAASLQALQAQVNTTSAAIADVNNNKLAAYWQVTASSGSGQARLNLASNNGATSFLIDAANTYISGNLILGGSLQTAAVADNAITNGDFVASSSSFQGQGGVQANQSNYVVGGTTYYG